jgi:diguanylate cyclase (GGDEF)-like protein
VKDMLHARGSRRESSRPTETRRGIGATSRTVILCGMGVMSGLTMVLTAVVTLRGADRSTTELVRRIVPAEVALDEASAAGARSTGFFERALVTSDAPSRLAEMGMADVSAQSEDKAWAAYKAVASDGPEEHRLQKTYETARAESRRIGTALFSLDAKDPSFRSTVDEERGANGEARDALRSLRMTVYEPLLRHHASTASAGIGRAVVGQELLYLGLAGLFSVVGWTLLRGARRDENRFTAEAAATRIARDEAALEGSLQRGLEMAATEEHAFDIVDGALAVIAPDVPIELLLADSSRAHFRQVVGAPETAHGCRVSGPGDCPAAASGQTRSFPDSRALDACRHLRGGDDPVWAVCVPVSIAGQTTGVLHAQERRDVDAPDRMLTSLELLARRTGERIGSLRVLARSEAQAQLDPLTGLPNRRTLDDQVQEVLTQETPYVVAFADLDLFKSINDAHGHETGDRALRLFARVLRDSIRPSDLLARYGGEEFIAVLPACTLADARVIAERIRSTLAKAVAAATVPPFTVTIGLAVGVPGEPLSEVVARADAAMLGGKSAGRDRVATNGEDVTTIALELLLDEAGKTLEARL